MSRTFLAVLAITMAPALWAGRRNKSTLQSFAEDEGVSEADGIAEHAIDTGEAASRDPLGFSMPPPLPKTSPWRWMSVPSRPRPSMPSMGVGPARPLRPWSFPWPSLRPTTNALDAIWADSGPELGANGPQKFTEEQVVSLNKQFWPILLSGLAMTEQPITFTARLLSGLPPLIGETYLEEGTEVGPEEEGVNLNSLSLRFLTLMCAGLLADPDASGRIWRNLLQGALYDSDSNANGVLMEDGNKQFQIAKKAVEKMVEAQNELIEAEAALDMQRAELAKAYEGLEKEKNAVQIKRMFSTKSLQDSVLKRKDLLLEKQGHLKIAMDEAVVAVGGANTLLLPPAPAPKLKRLKRESTHDFTGRVKSMKKELVSINLEFWHTLMAGESATASGFWEWWLAEQGSAKDRFAAETSDPEEKIMLWWQLMVTDLLADPKVAGRAWRHLLQGSLAHRVGDSVVNGAVQDDPALQLEQAETMVGRMQMLQDELQRAEEAESPNSVSDLQRKIEMSVDDAVVHLAQANVLIFGKL